MGVLGVFIGCRGDGGFNGRCSGASIGDGGFMLACISGCRGVIGFNLAASLRPVREKVRPAHEKWPKICVCGVLGELFREYTAGWGTLGELFRACCGKGRHSDGFFVE